MGYGTNVEGEIKLGFKDLTEIKSGYDSGFDDILNEFYIPVLEETKYYKRIAGFFSSSSLSVAARGITRLIKNEGHMDLLVSPKLTHDDIEIMQQALNDPQEIISKVMLLEIDNLESLLQRKRVDALGWLLANGYLTIKVATVYDDNGHIMDYEKVEEFGLFHIKVGILEDNDGNVMTFSGSINETASAWVRNIEEFKVFKYWEEGKRDSAQIDIDKFNNYWDGKNSKVKVTDLPSAVSEKLIQNAPKDIAKLEDEIVREELMEKKTTKLNFCPFVYQEEALKVWQKHHRAIFEMATGTGKTKTAQLCIADFINTCTTPKVIFVICPQDTLARQWLEDIKNSGLEWGNYIIVDSSVSSSKIWRDQLAYKLLEINVQRVDKKDVLFVYSTFDTYCKNVFIETVKKYKHKSTYFFIGDEVHGLGSAVRARGFLEEYDLRLGLSATPERWFDEHGTRIIKEYFGEDKYSFTIEEALNKKNPLTGKTYLTPYKYIPKFVTLDVDELMKYKELTESIVRSIGKAKSDSDIAEKIDNLMFLRADVHKSAKNKLVEFEKILDEIGEDLKDTIIFTSPNQIDDVEKILKQRGVFAKRFTKDQGTTPLKQYGDRSERQHIIDIFVSGECKVLVAIKCLDEGIDIPSARRAIILASSTNPREYVQRIGRIIRRSEGKEQATIYDIIVEPSLNDLEGDLVKYERKIFEKEMVRINEISQNALNRLEIINEVYSRLL